jgi:hypothetical protein
MERLLCLSLFAARGGGVCESNTPRRLFTPHDGFEDRGTHQDPSASVGQLCGGAEAVSNRGQTRCRGRRAAAVDERYLIRLSPSAHSTR